MGEVMATPGSSSAAAGAAPLRFEDDWHWNPRGHALIGEALAEHVSQLPR